MFVTIASVLAILVVLVVLVSSYKKPQPNQALIVTGFGLKESKAVRGRGVFVIPFLQTSEPLDLKMFTLGFAVKNVNTKTQVPLNVEGNVTLGIGSDAVMITTAAQRLLGKEDADRNEDLIEPIKGQVRGLLGNMLPQDVTNNRNEFQKNVMDNVAGSLAAFGMEATSIQITSVSDDNGFIESLYAQDVANRKAQAEIAQANADRESREANAEQSRLAKQAEEEANRKVAEQETQTAVKKAEFKIEQDAKQGQADQAYKLAEAEASKKVIETEGQANTLQAEQDAKVAEKSVETAKQKLEAEIVAKTNAEAEAKKIEAQANADALNATTQAESNKVKEMGKAEAEAIELRGKAEATAQEALANALKENGDIVLMQAVIDKLPEIAQAYADAIKSINNVTVFDGGSGVDGMMGEGLAQTFQFVKESTGLDLAEIAKQRGEGRITLSGNDTKINVESNDESSSAKVEPNQAD